MANDQSQGARLVRIGDLRGHSRRQDGWLRAGGGWGVGVLVTGPGRAWDPWEHETAC